MSNEQLNKLSLEACNKQMLLALHLKGWASKVMEETKGLKDKCSLYVYISYNKYSIIVQITDYWNAVENGLSYNMALAHSSKFNINISEAQR